MTDRAAQMARYPLTVRGIGKPKFLEINAGFSAMVNCVARR
jgi:hypothetical protein